MTLKIWIKSGKSETITIQSTLNFCLIHKLLNERYGINGWLGYEVLN